MNITREINFLKAVAANNDRQWMQEHKDEFTACRKDFEQTVTDIITEFTKFDP